MNSIHLAMISFMKQRSRVPLPDAVVKDFTNEVFKCVKDQIIKEGSFVPFVGRLVLFRSSILYKSASVFLLSLSLLVSLIFGSLLVCRFVYSDWSWAI